MDSGRAGGPDEIVAGAPDDERPSRRRWSVAALLLAAVGVVIVRPDLSLLADQPAGSPSGRPSSSLAPGGSQPRAGIPWQPRGDLVGDDDFVRAATERIRTQRPASDRLFFAGRLPDGSRLVLAGTDINRGIVTSQVHALLVPRGASVASAPVREAPPLSDPQQVLAWATRGRDGQVVGVAMVRPGPARFEVSTRVHFRPNGATYRQWTPVAAPDGFVVGELGPDADPVVAVRAAGPGVFTQPLLARVAAQPPAGRAVFDVAGTEEPGYRGPEAAGLSRALHEGAGFVADLEASRLEVIWSGRPVPSRLLALVLITRPDGQRLQALVGEQAGYVFSAGVRALADSASRQLPWLLEPFSPQDPTLLLCPTGSGSIVYHRDGQPDRVLRADDRGIVSLVEPNPSPPTARGAEVTLLDPAGAVLLRTVLSARSFNDLLALD